MIRILFVCHGNICRSPMAEFIMKDMVSRAGLTDESCIESAATSREEIGNDMYPPAKRCLAAHGIPYERRRSRQMTREDYAKFDYLIGADAANISNMTRIAGGDPDHKIFKLLSFAGEDRNVADPWYTDDFETTYADTVTGCRALLEYLKENRQLAGIL